LSFCTACVYNASSANNYSCTGCSGGKTALADGSDCVDGPPNCAVLATNPAECATCNAGFTVDLSDPTTCLECSTLVTGCDACNYGGSPGTVDCTSCTGTEIPQLDGQTCVEPSANCAVLNGADF